MPELKQFPLKTSFCVIQQPRTREYVVAAFLPNLQIEYICGFKTQAEATRWKTTQDIKKEKAEMKR